MLMRRRYVVLALLFALSGLALAGVWGWLSWVLASGQADGINPIALTVRANGLAYQATWAYVAGAVIVHALTGVVAWRRADREAWIGVVVSAILHTAGLVALGVLAPPG